MQRGTGPFRVCRAQSCNFGLVRDKANPFDVDALRHGNETSFINDARGSTSARGPPTRSPAREPPSRGVQILSGGPDHALRLRFSPEQEEKRNLNRPLTKEESENVTVKFIDVLVYAPDDAGAAPPAARACTTFAASFLTPASSSHQTASPRTRMLAQASAGGFLTSLRSLRAT